MGEVVDLFQRRAAAPAAAPSSIAASGAGPSGVRQHEGPAIQASAGLMANTGGSANLDKLRDMEKQGAAFQVLSALLFYAHQGHDDGARARRAVIGMQELLGLAPPPAVA